MSETSNIKISLPDTRPTPAAAPTDELPAGAPKADVISPAPGSRDKPAEPAAPPTPPAPKPIDHAKSWEKLTKQERKLREEREAFESSRQKWQTEDVAKFEAERKAAAEREQLFRTNPEEALKFYGHNPNDFLDWMAKGGTGSEAAKVKALESTIERFQRETKEKEEAAAKKLEDDRAEERKQQEAETLSRATSVLTTAFKDDERFVASRNWFGDEEGGPESFAAETIDVVKKHFAKHADEIKAGRMKGLTLEEAALAIEKHLATRFEKVQSAKQPKPSEQPGKPGSEEGPRNNTPQAARAAQVVVRPRSLTNKSQAIAPTRTAHGERKTPEQVRAEAIAAIRIRE